MECDEIYKTVKRLLQSNPAEWPAFRTTNETPSKCMRRSSCL